MKNPLKSFLSGFLVGMSTPITTQIDHLFRNEYAKLISYLTSKFGVSHMDCIEDAVQDALLKAMQLWSYNEIPNEPGKWLYRVSYNKVIDSLRRQSKTLMFNPEIMTNYLEEDYELEQSIEDPQLQMIFACCHPSISENDQIMLSLNLLCGFSIPEMSRVLLKKPEAIKKGLSRAKKQFKTKVDHLAVPSKTELPERLNTVLKVIYLLFTNGYNAYKGNELIKREVCEDAIRLAGLLHVNAHCSTPQLHALIALMCFNLSRFEARISPKGDLVAMENQNRQLWDRDLIQVGNKFILLANTTNGYSKFHLEAAIAREYALSSSYRTINWSAILAIYDVLIGQNQSATLTLNRLVVLSKVKGEQRALNELNLLDEKVHLTNHHYYSIKGDLEKKLQLPTYKISLEKAISLTQNEKEKAFLTQKL